MARLVRRWLPYWADRFFVCLAHSLRHRLSAWVARPGSRHWNGSRKINCGGPAYMDHEPDQESYVPVDDFYRVWARGLFGPSESDNVATVFAYLDGFLPRVVRWVNGPGGLNPDYEDWTVKA